MSDFPFDTFRGIQNGDDATLDDVNVQQITFPDGSTQTEAAGSGSVVTDLDFAGTTLTLKQSGGADKTATIPSGALPFAFSQTDDQEEITDTGYFKNATGTAVSFDDVSGGAAITDLQTSITPTSTSQKVVITVDIFGQIESPQYAGIILKRTIGGGSPSFIIPDADNRASRMSLGGTFAIAQHGADNNSDPQRCNMTYVDSPDTTSAVTYVPHIVALNWGFSNRSFYLNRQITNSTSNPYHKIGLSTMTLECKDV